MVLASYYEDIVERLDEEQRAFREEIERFRGRITTADWVDAEAIETDIRAFRDRLTHFLDELQQRCDKIFGEAKNKLRDHDVNVAAALRKKDKQLADVRDQREELKSQLAKSRESLQRHMRDLDELKRECKKLRERDISLQREHSRLVTDLQNCREFLKEMRPK